MASSALILRQEQTLRELARDKLIRLGRAAGMASTTIESAVKLFFEMSQDWGEVLPGEQPPWPNDISDDGTPFEFSVAVSNVETELRILLEAQRHPWSSRSSYEAGCALHDRLANKGIISTERFDAIASLFRPRAHDHARFSLWHAAVVRAGKAPLVKAYLNPEVHGPVRANALVREALSEVGLRSTWRYVKDVLGRAPTGRMRYFALDLDASRAARVKIYISATTANEVEAQLVGCANVQPGQATEWLRLLTHSSGPFSSRPILTCFAFTDDGQAPVATVHVPVRCYVDEDQEALDRLRRVTKGEAQRRMVRAVTQSSLRPLHTGRGLVTYISLREQAEGTRVTAYFAQELYAIAAPRRHRLVYA